MRRGRGKGQVRSAHSAGSGALPAQGAMSATWAVTAAVHWTMRPARHRSARASVPATPAEGLLVMSAHSPRTSEHVGSGSCWSGASSARSERESILPATPPSARAVCSASTAAAREDTAPSSSEVSAPREAAAEAGTSPAPTASGAWLAKEERARTKLTCDPRKPPNAELKAAMRQMGMVSEPGITGGVGTGSDPPTLRERAPAVRTLLDTSKPAASEGSDRVPGTTKEMGTEPKGGGSRARESLSVSTGGWREPSRLRE
mmetsp:Transcript_7793/g.22763  ORF Transcript_7793/g.22763 Transcript_7793/m.22763 type:complete len:260 (+) Transcript_7793:1017-1796(+)